ncbi:hypothetical protein VTL71DRAFT_6820 [Oculimacula yallundae]|uniref:Uncharacterized protein n=1 Tax=Oculimacula yallundae TaxID=86028 RepID=A0ABR4BZQ5_9HELO
MAKGEVTSGAFANSYITHHLSLNLSHQIKVAQEIERSRAQRKRDKAKAIAEAGEDGDIQFSEAEDECLSPLHESEIESDGEKLHSSRSNSVSRREQLVMLATSQGIPQTEAGPEEALQDTKMAEADDDLLASDKPGTSFDAYAAISLLLSEGLVSSDLPVLSHDDTLDKIVREAVQNFPATRHSDNGTSAPKAPKTDAECGNCKGLNDANGVAYDFQGHQTKHCTRNLGEYGMINACPWCNTREHNPSTCPKPKSLSQAYHYILQLRDGKPAFAYNWDIQGMFKNLWETKKNIRPQTPGFVLSQIGNHNDTSRKIDDPYWDQINIYNGDSWKNIFLLVNNPSDYPPLDYTLAKSAYQLAKGGRVPKSTTDA